MNLITLTIVALAAFIADKGATLDASSIKATPSNVVQMEGVLPTARFTSIPFLTQSRFLKVKLSAYHPSGIKYVQFSCNGMTQKVSRMKPDQTGYYEYSYGIKAGRMAPGLYEVTATIVPNEGPSLTLAGNSKDFTQIRNGFTGFFFNVGPKASVTVGPGGEFATMKDAVDAFGEDLTHGGTITLMPGTYQLELPRLRNGDSTMTVDGRGKVTIVSPNDGPQIDRESSMHFTRCEFQMQDEGGRFFRGGRDARLVITDSRIFSTNPDGYRLGGQYIGQSYEGGLNYGWWMEDVLIENVWKGVNGIHTAKRVTLTRNNGDAFGSSPGAVIDCVVLNAVKDETFHGQHCDIVQLSTGMLCENRIYADIFAPNHQAQIGHFSNRQMPDMKNIAFVNWVVDARNAERSVNINMIPTVDGLIMHNLWFYNGAVNWSGEFDKHQNVSIRNCTFFKDTIGADPFDNYEDVQIHYTDRYRTEWDADADITLGPITILDDLTWEVSQ